MHSYRPIDHAGFSRKLLQNSAFATLESAKHSTLLRFMEQGGKVLFVFDTDVIKTFCAPWQTGPINKQKHWSWHLDGGVKLEEVESGTGYGVVVPWEPVPDDPDIAKKRSEKELKDAVSVATVLAHRFIELVKAENSIDTIVQLDNHFKETENVYRSVKADADGIGYRSFGAQKRIDLQIANAIKLVKASLAGDISKEESNDYFAIKLVEFLTERQLSKPKVVNEWDNFFRLHTDYNGIYSTRVLGDIENNVSTDQETEETKDGRDLRELSNIFFSVSGVGGGIKSKDLVSEFERKIIAEGGKRHKSTVKDDAEAVAELYLVNKALHKKNQIILNERKKVSPDLSIAKQNLLRVVMVTGDFNLVNAFMHGVVDDAEGQEEFDANFGYDCVHHLWSVLDEEYLALENGGSSQPVQGHGVNFDPGGSIFSGFLAYRDSTLSANEQFEQLRDIIRAPENHVRHSTPSDGFDQALERWHEFIKRARIQARSIELRSARADRTEELRSEIRSVISQRLANPNLTWADIERQVEEVVQRAKDRANTQFSNIGSAALIAAHKNGYRNPPDLIFGSMPHTDDIFKKLSSPTRFYHNALSFINDYTAMERDAYCDDGPKEQRDDRQLVHLQYLVLGALFASADRWPIAQQHAANAVAIIERAGGPHNNIPVKNDKTFLSGREAYYLQAVAQRVRANNAKDFEEASRLLTVAKERFDLDREMETAPTVSEIRFENERLANALGIYYFRRQEDESKFYDELVEKVMVEAQTVNARWQKMKADDNNEEIFSGERWSMASMGTKVSCATNIIQCKVIEKFRANNNRYTNCPWKTSDISEASDIIFRNTDFVDKLNFLLGREVRLIKPKNPTVICSQMMLRYVLVANMITGENEKVWKPKNRFDIESVFADTVKITKYDEWRYDSLKNFALELFG